jgi:hypothetical protein
MILWATVSTYRTFPHTLSYFNELTGGPDRGYEYLIDSNIDWGQDLLLLKWWVERHPNERPMYIGYKNLVDYRHAGFELAPAPEDPPPRVASDGEWQKFGPRQGIYAIDVHGFTEGEYKWFRMFTPVAKAGYTIFIYRITHEQAAEARVQMGLPPLNEN